MVINNINDFLIKKYLKKQFPETRIINPEKLSTKQEKPRIIISNTNSGTFPIYISYLLNKMELGNKRNIKPINPVNLLYREPINNTSLNTWFKSKSKNALKKFFGKAVINYSNIIQLQKIIKKKDFNQANKIKLLEDLLQENDLFIQPNGEISINGRIDYTNPKTNDLLRFTRTELKELFNFTKGELLTQPIYLVKDQVFNINYGIIGESKHCTEELLEDNNWYLNLMKTIQFITPIQVKYLKHLVDRKNIYEKIPFEKLLKDFRKNNWQIPNFEGKTDEELKSIYEVNHYLNTSGHERKTFEVRTYKDINCYQFVSEEQYNLNHIRFLKEALKRFFRKNYKITNNNKEKSFWKNF